MPPIQIVRPMLAVRRSQIEEFCRAEGLSWRTDSSNQDPRFRRNYLRHHLLPLLRRHENPEVDDAILQLAAAAGQVDSLLTAQASDLLGRAVCGMGVSPMCGTGVPPVSVLSEASLSLDIAPFAANPLIVQTTALRLAMEGLGCPMQAVGRDHLESMVAVLQPHGPESISLPGGWQLVRQGERVEFRGPRGEGVPLADRSPANSAERQASPTPQGVKLPDETPAPFACPGLTVLPDGTRVRCEILPMDRPAFDRHLHGHPPGVEWLDADAVHLPLTCRPRRKGDRFHPLGAAGRQTVSNFLTNLKLPPAQRRAVRCICDETGIVYVWPLRLDHRVRATPQTRRVLRIEVTPASSLTSPGPSDRPRA